jgi:hypothetical protein
MYIAQKLSNIIVEMVNSYAFFYMEISRGVQCIGTYHFA